MMDIKHGGAFIVAALALILQVSGVFGFTSESERSLFSRAVDTDFGPVTQKISQLIWKDAAACPIAAAFAQIRRLNNEKAVENALTKALSLDPSIVVKAKADGVRDVICEASQKFRTQLNAAVSFAKSTAEEPRPEFTEIVDNPWISDEHYEDAIKNLKKGYSQTNFKQAAESADTKNLGSSLYDRKLAAYKKLTAVRGALRNEILNIQSAADYAVNALRDGTQALNNIRQELSRTRRFPESIDMDESSVALALAVGQELGCAKPGDLGRINSGTDPKPTPKKDDDDDLGRVSGPQGGEKEVPIGEKPASIGGKLAWMSEKMGESGEKKTPIAEEKTPGGRQPAGFFSRRKRTETKPITHKHFDG
ncbi:unnamed protein product [Bemisia tabaci]|uniref:Uncharacterized protein n=1 Tax=Bemisia tabaci TaxID=7038 RepID=A0A9P0CFQ4_BEMTA|nr:unnamed protein product [Bemisia tabaci]